MNIDTPHPSASSLHKEVHKVLSTSKVFNRFTIRQEVNVKDLASHCTNSRLRVDWFIREMGVCIEVMGSQHVKGERFGGISQFNADSNLVSTKKRDFYKERVLNEAGYIVIYLWYHEKISEDLIKEKILEATAKEDTIE